MIRLPLFPLNTVLFPNASLSLKIFEPRYVDLIARCMREQSEFGVVLIHDGDETNPESEIFSVGTTAAISDWQQREDGLLGITVQGMRRFVIEETQVLANKQVMAGVEFLQDEDPMPTPEQFDYMPELLNHIYKQSNRPLIEDDTDFITVLNRLSDLLPLESKLKQRLLEISRGLDRATVLHAELIRLGVIQFTKME